MSASFLFLVTVCESSRIVYRLSGEILLVHWVPGMDVGMTACHAGQWLGEAVANSQCEFRNHRYVP